MMRILRIALTWLVCSAFLLAAESGSSEEARTLDEWHTLYLAMFKNRCREWRKIVSDTEKFNAFYGNLDEVARLQHQLMLRILSYRVPWFGEDKTGVDSRAKLIREYDQWLKEKGWDMMQRWRAGKLAPEEEAYMPLLRIGYVYEGYFELQGGKREGQARRELTAPESACVQWVENLVKRLDSTKKKALARKPLTQADLDVFRAAAAMDRMRNMAPGDPHFPLDRRKTRELSSGTEKAEWFFPRLEKTFESPDYTDLYPRHPYDLFFPESALWVLQRLVNFRMDAEGKVEPRPEVLEAMKNDPNNFRLSDFRGKKMVLLVYTDHMNDHDDHGRHMHWTIMEQLYGDHVEVIFMYAPKGDFEQWFPPQNPFGPPMDYSRIGTVGIEFLGSCQPTREELARDVRQSLILYPNLSHTYTFGLPDGVIHDSIRTSSHDMFICLVDIDGTVVFHGDNPFPYVHGSTGIQRHLYSVPVVEKEIRRMIANGGRTVDGARQRLSMKNIKGWMPPEGGRLVVNRWPNERLYRFEVYDARTQCISARPWDEKKKQVQDEVHNIKLDFDAAKAGYSVCHINNQEVDPGEFKPGDLLHMKLYTYPDKEQLYAHLVGMNNAWSRKSPHGLGNPYPCERFNSYWVRGTVKKADAENRLIEVTRDKPEPEKMHGMRYIEAAGDNIHLFGSGRTNYNRVKLSLREYEESPEVILKVIPGAYLFRNGEDLRGDLSPAQPGDKVLFLYDRGKNEKTGLTLTGDVRFASSIVAADTAEKN